LPLHSLQLAGRVALNRPSKKRCWRVLLAIERRVEQEHVPDLSALDPKHAAKRPTLSIAEGAAEQRALRHVVRNRECCSGPASR
jgi:hypothetical protein